MFNCPFFTNANEILPLNLKYEDMFENNVIKQINVMKIFYARYEVRKSYLPSQQSDVRTPVDPSRVPGLHQVRRLGIKEAKLRNKNKKQKQDKGSQKAAQ